MGLSDDLWADNQDLAKGSLDHPFVQGLADGTLARRSFEHYIAQDAFFLDAFARAYGLCLAKAPDRSSLLAFKALLDGVVDEQGMHARYAERWGVDLHPSPTPATRAYTDFLLRTAALEPVGHTCAAMTPCMRLYAWLGQSLSPVLDPASPYAEWVHTYGADAFDELANDLEVLTDQLAGDRATMATRYRTAMRLELDFFASAHWYGQDHPA